MIAGRISSPGLCYWEWSATPINNPRVGGGCSRINPPEGRTRCPYRHNASQLNNAEKGNAGPEQLHVWDNIHAMHDAEIAETVNTTRNRQK